MSDFSIPNATDFYGVLPSQVNLIEPGKRPLTSMSPTVVTNSATGAVRMVIGAAGGTQIPTATSYVNIFLALILFLSYLVCLKTCFTGL